MEGPLKKKGECGDKPAPTPLVPHAMPCCSCRTNGWWKGHDRAVALTGARVNMWSSRHAVLRGARLQFYRKKEDESNKREVLIVPGCFVSEVGRHCAATGWLKHGCAVSASNVCMC